VGAVAALAVVDVSQHWDHCGGFVHAVHDGRDADPVKGCRNVTNNSIRMVRKTSASMGPRWWLRARRT
jgi:hypothetical protein